MSTTLRWENLFATLLWFQTASESNLKSFLFKQYWFGLALTVWLELRQSWVQPKQRTCDYTICCRQGLTQCLAKHSNSKHRFPAPSSKRYVVNLWPGVWLQPSTSKQCSECRELHVPDEIKRREVELDPQVIPEETMSREVELGCESWTSFAWGLSLWLCPARQLK